MLRLGVYGHGPQSKRYLDPLNWPEGVEVGQLSRGANVEFFDGVIVATAPAFHSNVACRNLRKGIPVLCEKPMDLTLLGGSDMVLASTHAPLLIAHTHLWHREFNELVPSKTAMVQWCGEERPDGSCSALLDWGPHAWSMAIALGTDRVITGKGDRSKNVVRSRGKRYPGDGETPCRPMKEMLATFASLIDGGYDWRAEPDFALAVHRRCFKAADSTHRSGK